MTLTNQTIFVAGHQGMVGKALVRALQQRGCTDLLLRTRADVDLTNQAQVDRFFADHQPAFVIMAAGRVAGIMANRTYPADFLYQNLMMAANVIHAADRHNVGRLLFLGSTCVYPREAEQPLGEDCLLTGPLETTNEAYALAKITGLKLCQYYRSQYGRMFHSAMPTNLYGPGDNYHTEHSHVLPALIRRFHEAKQQGRDHVVIWGTGKPRREFLHVNDLADALLHLLELDNPPDWVNIGTGIDISIRQLAEKIAEVVGFEGEIRSDPSKPDGTPVKRSDISRIKATGWQAKIDLDTGLRTTYQDFLAETDRGVLRQV